MKFRFILVFALLAMAQHASAQVTGDALGVHDLGPQGSKHIPGGSIGCQFCHAPHSAKGDIAPLWNHQLPASSYSVYTSTTAQNTGNAKPPVSSSSLLCLSCHDGTVGLGQTLAYGDQHGGYMQGANDLTTKLQGSHPFSLALPVKDTPNLAASLVGSGKTSDPTNAVHLVKGNVECDSCHNPHVQWIDRIAKNFLARDSSSGQLCLQCHDPARSISGKVNVLAAWPTSIHAIAPNKTNGQTGIGSYSTVAGNACSSCHQQHSATAGAGLLRTPNPPISGMDAETQNCLTCHSNSSSVGSPDIYSEMGKAGTGTGAAIGTVHPVPLGVNLHDAAEPALLQNNRHATCVDCHSPHSAQKVSSFNAAPAIRPSQAMANAGVAGISVSDGKSVLAPAVNQYENCLRCHGTSSGKQALASFGYLPARTSSDPLNVIIEFMSTTSSHPVAQHSVSKLSQPSLLPKMLDKDGNATGRSLDGQVFCTDCHNSEDNREIGGAGPNGPHGSKWAHLLERRYEMSQAALPGQPLTSGTTNVNFSLNTGIASPGPYALCAKCHNLSTGAGGILSDASFKPSATTNRGGHNTHAWEQGVSCSVCHTAHGSAPTTTNSTGERLVNFDLNVVGPNGTNAISYDRASNTCTLTCHNYAHARGSVQPAIALKSGKIGAGAKPVK